MKTAVIGSRNLKIKDISKYIPEGTDEIVTGGARGIDSCAADSAKRAGLKLTVFPPNYRMYGRGAPIVRNREIVECADCVVAIWDGSSRGTKSVIDECVKTGVEVRVILINNDK